jgi:hypothetical protein
MWKFLLAPFENMTEEQGYVFAQKHGQVILPASKRMQYVFSLMLVIHASLLVFMYGSFMLVFFALAGFVTLVEMIKSFRRGLFIACALLGYAVFMCEMIHPGAGSMHYAEYVQAAVINMIGLAVGILGLVISKTLFHMGSYKGEGVQLELPV